MCALREACVWAGVLALAVAALAFQVPASGPPIIMPVANVKLNLARRALGVFGVVLLLVPRVVLAQLLARLEVAPWPRGAWASPTPYKALLHRPR